MDRMDVNDGPLPEVRGQRNGSTLGTPHSGSSQHGQASNVNGNNNNVSVNNSNNNSNNSSNLFGGDNIFQPLSSSSNNNVNSNNMNSNNNDNNNAQNQPFLGAGNFTDVPVQQAFEATGFMDSNNSNSNMDFLGPVEGVYDAINFPEGILDFYGWGRFFEGSAQTGLDANVGGGGGDNSNGFGGLQDQV